MRASTRPSSSLFQSDGVPLEHADHAVGLRGLRDSLAHRGEAVEVEIRTLRETPRKLDGEAEGRGHQASLWVDMFRSNIKLRHPACPAASESECLTSGG